MPPTPSISPALNSVTSSISFSASRYVRCSEAIGLVKQPSSGVASTTSLRARMPRSRRYQSARNANSIGATGHLIGMSAMFTTSRPPSKRSSAPRKRLGAVRLVEGEDALVPAGAGHAFGLLRQQPYAARDDEYVVREHGSVPEHVPRRARSGRPRPRPRGRRCRRAAGGGAGARSPRRAARPNGTKSRPGW